ncbi:MAG: Gfo/Idh/MocA family oxidoreductase [Trueperaceae bacterium]|nr:Gfo/Idh/MocA family oxidoreductase [Trueperaceae bacterium]
MSERPLNIALIGYGGIGRVHAMAYRDIPFTYGLPARLVNLAAVATTRAETAEKAAKEIGCELYTANYHELLECPDIDLIDCCTPNSAHKDIILAAAKAGKHIYCEKPLAMNLLEAQEMLDAVQAAGVKTQMTFNFRFFPAILRAKELIEAGFLGRVFSFRGRYYRSSYIDPEKPLSWRLSKDVSGGGALFDLGSHIIDLLYYLLGPFASVQANLDTLIKERPIKAGSTEKGPVDVDDFALITARLASGTLGHIEISRMGTGVNNECLFEIYGDKGSIRFNAEDPSYLEVYDVRDSGTMRGFKKLETIGRYPGQKAPDGSMPTGFVRTHAECQYQFLKAIWEDRDGSPNFADGLHVQAIMEAAARAAKQGNWTEV